MHPALPFLVWPGRSGYPCPCPATASQAREPDSPPGFSAETPSTQLALPCADRESDGGARCTNTRNTALRTMQLSSITAIARRYRLFAHRPWLTWGVIFIPLADRLNFNPPDCECTLMTTPFSFLR